MMNNRNIYLICLLLFPLLFGSGASSAAVCDFSTVDSAVDDLLQSNPQIPGVGLQIGYSDEVIYEKYWGQYDNTTVVPLASATKLLSAVAIMTLVDAGLIDLDLPVSNYLPQFSGDKGRMTVRQMFSHTAGMPTNDLLENSTVLNALNGLTLAEAVDTLACCEPLLYQPGEGFAYGGSSMHIAGRVAEVVDDNSWVEIFNQRVAAPLEITGIDYTRSGTTENYRIAGGARSSLPEYAKVLNMLLNKGRHQTGRILSKQSVDTMISDNVGALNIIYAPPQVPGEVRYGIGSWLSLDENGTTSLTSPGAFGFTPWVDYDLNYYAAFMVVDSNTRMAPLVTEIRTQIRQILADNWCGSMPESGVVVPCVDCEQYTQRTEPHNGMWYNQDQSAQGFSIDVQNGKLFGVYYGYDQAGAAIWQTFVGDLVPSGTAGVMWTVDATLNQFSNSNCFNCEIKGFDLADGGSIQIKFRHKNYASIRIDGGAEQHFTPFVFGHGATADFPDQSKYLLPDLEGMWTLVYRINDVAVAASVSDQWGFNSKMIHIGKKQFTQAATGLEVWYSIEEYGSSPEVVTTGTISCKLEDLDGQLQGPVCKFDDYVPFWFEPLGLGHEFIFPLGGLGAYRIFGETIDGHSFEAIKVDSSIFDP